jgi:hypothetical protein
MKSCNCSDHGDGLGLGSNLHICLKFSPLFEHLIFYICRATDTPHIITCESVNNHLLFCDVLVLYGPLQNNKLLFMIMCTIC